VLELNGNWAEAESLYVDALAMRRRFLGPDHQMTVASLNNLAIVRYRMGDPTGAAAAFRQAASSWNRTLGPRHAYTLSARNNLGAALSDAGRYGEAEAELRAVLALRREQGDSAVELGLTLRNLGSVLQRTRRLEEAERFLRWARAIYEARLPAGHPRAAEALSSLGAVLADRGRPSAAEPLLREALRIRVENLDSTDIRIAETRMDLALALRALGRGREADSLLRVSCRAFAASAWAARQLADCRARTEAR
jgi:tetratricopeptide (TPR) repeat protein